MKVAILVYNNCSLWAATGVMEILLRANKAQSFILGNLSKEFFDVEFVSCKSESIKTYYNIPISYNSTIYENKYYDLVIITGTDSNPLQTVKENTDAALWIKNQYLNHAKIASICTGSFLLASSGIIDHKVATTHWFMANQFKSNFPNIYLQQEKIIVDNGDIFLSGGASSFQNLMIYLIEKFMGKRIAIAVSKLYLIDNIKDNQNSYSILNIQKNHQDKEILKAQIYIENNFANKFTLQEISDHVSMSRRNLIRRFKSATGDTPFQYIQKVKVEEAKKKLETERKSFEEIVFEIGYENVDTFRKLFIKYTGVTPGIYKKRYNVSYLN